MIEWFLELDTIWQLIVGAVAMLAVFTVLEVVFKTLSVAISVAVIIGLVYFGWLFFIAEDGSFEETMDDIADSARETAEDSPIQRQS